MDELRSDYFESLLLQLDPDRDRAGQKYEDLRRKLIKFFEWNACFPAEDLVDETFDRVAHKLEDVQVLDIVAFAWGFAKHIRQEAYKRSDRVVPISDLPLGEDSLTELRDPGTVVQEKLEDERRARRLRLCLQRLPFPDRQLFLRYHGGKTNTEHRHHLAGDLGLTIGALRVRINRLRERLEECVHSRMAGPSRRQGNAGLSG